MTSTWSFLTVAITIVIVCALACADPPTSQPAEFATEIVPDSDRLAMVATRIDRTVGAVWWATPLTLEAGALAPRGAGVPVSHVAVLPFAQPRHLDAARLGAARWAIVGDMFGGGDHILQYAEVGVDITGTPSPPDPGSLPHAKMVDWVELDGAGSSRHGDLTRPRLLVRGGRPYIVAACAGTSQNPSPMVWIGEAIPERGVLRGRTIGAGFDPKVGWLGDRAFCAVRLATESETNQNARPLPIGLFSSQDLVTWTGMPAPPTDFSVYRYDMRAGDGKLVILGVVRDGRALAKTMAYDPQTQRWTNYAPPIELTDVDRAIWLLPPAAGRPAFNAVVPENNVLRLRGLSQP